MNKRSFSLVLLSLLLGSNLKAQILPVNTNLFDLANSETYQRNSDVVQAENQANYKKFLALDVDKVRDSAKAKYLSPETAADVLDTLNANPVVSAYSYDKYDPENVGIGFCFGRAMFVNLELAQRGLDRDSIKKAFIVGPMVATDGSSWGWHVTTIAQSKDENGNKIWLALDPITGVKTVEAWYEEMFTQSTDKKLKLYITEAGKFGPTSGTYDEEHIGMGFYNKYFTDMMAWFEEVSDASRYTTKLTEY